MSHKAGFKQRRRYLRKARRAVERESLKPQRRKQPGKEIR